MRRAFPAWPRIRAGEFLLPSGLMAVGHDWHVVGRTVSPCFAALSHAGYTPAVAVYDYAEALCGSAGRSMANPARAQYFVSEPTAFPGIAMVWSARFGERAHLFVCIQTPPAAVPAPGVLLIADFWISVLSYSLLFQ